MTGTPVTGALAGPSYTLGPAGQAVPPAARTHTIPPPTPELLTESFCERCGTRYTFESAAPKARRPGLGRARVLSRGLKNWVVEDGRSIEAAMADARRDEERTLASAQLEAFHQTFNFCMDCRQYTCSDCWNQAEGRCQSCAPLPGALEAEPVAINGAEAGMAWPTLDLSAEEAIEPTGVTVETPAAAVPYLPTDLRPVELPDDDVETMIGVAALAASDADLVAEAGTFETPAGEREAGAVTVAAEAEALLATSGEVAGVEAESVAVEEEPGAPTARILEAAAIAAAAEAVAAEAEIAGQAPAAEAIVAASAEPAAPAEPGAPAEPSDEPEHEPIAAAAIPAWTIVAPDAPSDMPSAPPAWPPRAPVYQPPSQPPTPQAPGAGQPVEPAWPTVPPAAFSVPAAQVVWEESSLGVISRPGSGVQACVSCGLPLSATARFCRRCGTRQG